MILVEDGAHFLLGQQNKEAIRSFLYTCRHGLTMVVILAIVATAARSCFGGAYFTHSVATANASPLPGPSSEACTQTPSLAPTSRPTRTPSPTPLPTATLSPTHTPTSSATPAPSNPTSTPTGTPTQALTEVRLGVSAPLTFGPGTPTPTPVVLSRTNSSSITLGAPDPLPLVNQPQNVINVLLLGSDQVDIGRVRRTDTIIIAAIHPQTPSVSLLSIPRDFYAWMPGYGFGKINTAFSRGGPALMEATVRHNFGVDIDYCARVGLDSFIKIFDALGGVTVAVECPLHDTFPDASSPSGQTDVDLEPGMHHLDGKHALGSHARAGAPAISTAIGANSRCCAACTGKPWAWALFRRFLPYGAR